MRLTLVAVLVWSLYSLPSIAQEDQDRFAYDTLIYCTALVFVSHTVVEEGDEPLRPSPAHMAGFDLWQAAEEKGASPAEVGAAVRFYRRVYERRGVDLDWLIPQLQYCLGYLDALDN